MSTPARRPPGAIGWREEIAGGSNGALVAFRIAVPLGALAFAPLGPRFAGIAVAAALGNSLPAAETAQAVP